MGVMEAVCGCPRQPACVKPPREVQGDVPSLLSIDRRHDKLCHLISLQFVVLGLNRMKGRMLAGLNFLHLVVLK